MERKTYTTTATITKSRTDGSGEFEALVYDPDAGDTDGIVITRAALESAVETFNRRGRDLVLRWSHDLSQPDAALGVITKVWLDGSRLIVRGKLDLGNDLSVRVYEGMLAGRINEFSISWSAPLDAGVERDGKLFIVGDIELIEVSAVAAGANRGTRLLSIKAATTEAAKLRETILAAVAPTKAPNGADVAAELRAHDARVKAARDQRERAAQASAALDRFRTSNPRPTVLVADPKMRVVRDDERDFADADAKRRALASVSAGVGETVDGGVRIERAARPKPKRDETFTTPVYQNRND